MADIRTITATTTTSPATEPGIDSTAIAPPVKSPTKLTFIADAQYNVVSRVTSIQSRTLDERKRLLIFDKPKLHAEEESSFDISIRPQALVLATPILRREAEIRAAQFSPDAYTYELGDDLDTSNMSEVILDLTAYAANILGSNAAEQIFNLPAGTTRGWTNTEWTDFLRQDDKILREDRLEKIIALIAENDLAQDGDSHLNDFLPRAIGNHDGAAWGHGLDHTIPVFMLAFWSIMYQVERKEISRRIVKLETKRDRITRLERNLTERLRKIRDLTADIDRLNRRAEFVDQMQSDLTIESKSLETKLGQVAHSDSYGLWRFLVNQFFGANGPRNIKNPFGYWAANAGGSQYTIDKEDYIFDYLRTRYPEIGLTRSEYTHNGHYHRELMPLATLFNTKVPGSDPATESYYVYNSVRDPKTGEFRKDKTGTFLEERSMTLNLNDGFAGNYKKHFDNFWKEIRPGEFTCLVDVPQSSKLGASQHYILLQAFDQGINPEDGRRVFNIILDGTDHTNDNAELAFEGSMSRLQRQLCQVFIDYQTQKNENEGNGVMFLHSSHYALNDCIASHWKQNGWPEYFTQKNVVPAVFVGHGHEREITDESKPILLKHKFIDGKKPFYSIMTPSGTDAPNEYMTVEIHYDQVSNQYTLTQKYEPILPNSSTNNATPNDNDTRIDADVMQEVEKLRADYFRQHRYWEYSQLHANLLVSLESMLFSQDRVVAFDSIPISVGQFKEALVYADTNYRLLLNEFGLDNDFVKMVAKNLEDLKVHMELWLNGDPNAESKYDPSHYDKYFIAAKKMGYVAAMKTAETYSNPRDKTNLLTRFDDVFNDPSYEKFRMLIALTPRDAKNPTAQQPLSKAWQFWEYLGTEAAKEESLPINKSQIRHQELTKVPDSTSFTFTL